MSDRPVRPHGLMDLGARGASGTAEGLIIGAPTNVPVVPARRAFLLGRPMVSPAPDGRRSRHTTHRIQDRLPRGGLESRFKM